VFFFKGLPYRRESAVRKFGWTVTGEIVNNHRDTGTRDSDEFTEMASASVYAGWENHLTIDLALWAD